MKHIRFEENCLEKRAGFLLERGSFIELKTIKKETFALYELDGYFVEVVVGE